MKKLMLLAAMFAAFACGSAPQPSSGGDSGSSSESGSGGESGTAVIKTPAFAKGADISWASEMESAGKTFKKKDGTKADILAVLADCGVNAIRLRVWVDPYKGWSGKDDVLAIAKRVKAAGMALMVDFHYSDFFADPSRQKIPAAWEADKADLSKMCQHVADHTTDVLKALKDAGVTVNWVQIGNETRNGMLWPAGQLWDEKGNIADGRKHFAQLYNAGYDAAKALYPSAIVMPHLNNAYEDNEWWFREVKAEGAKFDAIALSHYPHYESKKNGTILTPQRVNEEALASIIALSSKFEVPVIVSEVGVNRSKSGAADLLASFMTEVRKISACKGVFYWEPEVDGVWKPEIYSKPAELSKYSGTTVSSAWGPHDQGAFTTDGKPTSILDSFAN